MSGDDAKELWFKEVIAANWRRIQAIARSYARSDECQDLCQDILLQMWRSLDHFAGRAAPATWVYRVALNTAITFRRKNGRRIESSVRQPSDTLPDPAVPPSPGNEIGILEEFLRTL